MIERQIIRINISRIAEFKISVLKIEFVNAINKHLENAMIKKIYTIHTEKQTTKNSQKHS